MKTKGVRILKFLDGVIPTIENVLATLTLFDGELQKDVTKQAQAANLDFMAKYAGRVVSGSTHESEYCIYDTYS